MQKIERGTRLQEDPGDKTQLVVAVLREFPHSSRSFSHQSSFMKSIRVAIHNL